MCNRNYNHLSRTTHPVWAQKFLCNGEWFCYTPSEASLITTADIILKFFQMPDKQLQSYYQAMGHGSPEPMETIADIIDAAMTFRHLVPIPK